jgi:hypothetical protein
MNLLTVFVCLATLANLPTAGGSGAKVKIKAKAKTKDPWDSPGEDGEAPPAGPVDTSGDTGGDEMSPEEQAAVMEKFQRQSAIRRAQKQHAVMKDFMKNFANNMRLAVLEDSRGDMPESKRQELMAKAEREREGGVGGPGNGGDDGPDLSRFPAGGRAPPEASPELGAGGEEEEMPMPRPRRRSHMLNMAAARQQQAQRRHRLLPEAEGIGFPAPEGMAADPSGDSDPSNNPGMAPPSSEESAESEAPPAEEAPAPRPQPRRRHLRMLNMAPGEGRSRNPSKRHAHGRQRQLPPGVVRDEMGRAMPLLFVDSKSAHSGAGLMVYMHMGTTVMCALMYLVMA